LVIVGAFALVVLCFATLVWAIAAIGSAVLGLDDKPAANTNSSASSESTTTTTTIPLFPVVYDKDGNKIFCDGTTAVWWWANNPAVIPNSTMCVGK
jgi:hypothetical protein